MRTLNPRFAATLALSLGVTGACGGGNPKGAQPGSGGAGASGGTVGAAGTTVPGGTSATAGTAGAVAQGGASGLGSAQAGSAGAPQAAAGTDGRGGNAGSIGVGGAGGSSRGGAPGTAGSGSGATGGASGEPRSCSASGPGLTNCGKNGNESCCTSPLVAGGTFSRTYTNSGSGATGTADPATVSAFRLDKYEITVGRFRQYVKYLNGGGTPPAAGSGKHAHLNGAKGLTDSGASGSFEPGWDAAWNTRIPSGAGSASQWNTALKCNKYGTWTDDAGANELLPMACLNWWESYAFCIWDGGFLPSEAEWRFAASGGDEHRQYPWGSTAPGTDSAYAIYDCCYPDKQCRSSGGGECAGFVNAAPVGFASMGATRYGQLDLSGSMFEWLVDHYAPFVSPCADCASFTATSSNRVLPGGGYRSALTYLPSSNRGSVSYAETFRGDFAVGARCARSP